MASELRVLTDLRSPHLWYPLARKMKRRWVLHIGPTNSGKTFEALQRLASVESGRYCGPLRLLAWEVYDKLKTGAVNGKPVRCSLMTGQEKVFDPKANHTSSTVEMADLDKVIDVAVIDEVQMLESNDRGWAWTRALLGLPAAEIHLCGEPRAQELITKLCDLCEDELEVKEYERLSSLSVANHSLEGSLRNIQRGDCIVAFGRSKIHQLKRDIEAKTPFRCCVVYGSLPPLTRQEQAKLFNERGSFPNGQSFDVLVASDAIGMGLNLEISRVVFSSLRKFDGQEERLLTASEIRQIGGRAGRFGTNTVEGIVTSLHNKDLPLLKRSFKTELPQIAKACLRPEIVMLEDFVHSIRHVWPREEGEDSLSLDTALQLFKDFHQTESSFFLGTTIDELRVSRQETEELVDFGCRTSQRRLSLSRCPSRIGSPSVWLRSISARRIDGEQHSTRWRACTLRRDS